MWPERALRSWEARPAVSEVGGWSTLATSLRLGRPGRLDEAAVLAGFPWQEPLVADGEPVGVAIRAIVHPEDPSRTLVWVGARAREAVRSPTPRDLLVVADISGSMASVLPGVQPGDAVRTRRDLVVLALEEIATHMGPDDRLGLVGFDRGASVLAPAAPSASAPSAELLAVDAADTALWRKDPVSVALELARTGQSCAEQRFLVLSDGDGIFGVNPPRTRAALAASTQRGATWSALTLAGDEDTVFRLQGLAWLGHGLHARVQSAHELRAAVRRILAPAGTVGRDLEWRLTIDAPHRRLHAEPVPTELSGGAVWTALYEVDSPRPTVSVQWTVSSPIPGEWTTQGSAELEGEVLPFANGPSDPLMAWVLSELFRWSRGEAVDLARLHHLAAETARPGIDAHTELVRHLERAVGRTRRTP